MANLNEICRRVLLINVQSKPLHITSNQKILDDAQREVRLSRGVKYDLDAIKKRLSISAIKFTEQGIFLRTARGIYVKNAFHKVLYLVRISPELATLQYADGGKRVTMARFITHTPKGKRMMEDMMDGLANTGHTILGSIDGAGKNQIVRAAK